VCKPELTGTLFPIYFSDVLAPLICWCPGQLPGWPAFNPALPETNVWTNETVLNWQPLQTDDRTECCNSYALHTSFLGGEEEELKDVLLKCFLWRPLPRPSITALMGGKWASPATCAIRNNPCKSVPWKPTRGIIDKLSVLTKVFIYSTSFSITDII
jgi:hypothetical protein